jgi:replicative DNA helicase
MTAPTTDAARALLGAALLSGATQVLDLLQDGDLADERLRVVAGVIRGMGGSGIPVDATTVLARARSTGTVTRPAAVQGLAVLLAELIGECPNPASARWYAAAVLEDALRRRTAEAGERLIQAAEVESLESLLKLVDREYRAVRELADRRTAAGEDRLRLRAVGA